MITGAPRGCPTLEHEQQFSTLKYNKIIIIPNFTIVMATLARKTPAKTSALLTNNSTTINMILIINFTGERSCDIEIIFKCDSISVPPFSVFYQ